MIRNKIDALSKIYCDRLRDTYIENNDALKVINTWDDEESFFYCDPPYVNSNMGHYAGYTEDDFVKLLDRLCIIKGKFLLSVYPSEILTDYKKRKNWKMCEFKKTLAVTSKRKLPKIKIECLVRNY